MSYRDLRAFCEMMRGLGFPRLVSVENFRNPNFPLVAELMAWLVKRYDPDVDVPLDVDTEQDRVIFVRSVAQLVAEKAHVKINTKRLYEADGHAVKEMLKVAKLLYGAVKDSDGEPMGTESGGGGGTSGTGGGAREVPVMFDAQAKISQLKRTRQLATEITVSGAKLYDLLGKEMHLRQARNTALGRQLELADVENNLRRAVSQVEQEIRSTSDGVDNIAQEEAAWDSKIDKKRIELDRVEKRLQTLRKVRPAFMDEYEKLEGEFKRLYEDYVTRFRCLAFLEQQLEDYEKTEQQRVEERQQAAQKLLDKLRQEDEKRMQGYNDLDDDDDDDDDDEVLNGVQRKRGTNAAGGRTSGSRRFGTMTGGDSENSFSLESDSDLDFEAELQENAGNGGPPGMPRKNGKPSVIAGTDVGDIGDDEVAAEGDVVTSAIAGSTVVMPATSVPPSRGNDGLESSVPVQIDDDDDDDF